MADELVQVLTGDNLATIGQVSKDGLSLGWAIANDFLDNLRRLFPPQCKSKIIDISLFTFQRPDYHRASILSYSSEAPVDC